jgi:Spy/CpxP family protein refolding chaperone
MRVRTVLLAAAWLFSGLVYADTPPHSQQHGPDMDRIALLLDLDDTQKSEVQKILEAQHEQMRTQMEQEHAAGTHPSRDEMRARHDKLKQDTLDKLSTVLNEQQLKKFAALSDHQHGPPHGRDHAHGTGAPQGATQQP